MRAETRYYYELEDGRGVKFPFDIEDADVTEIHREGKILLGCLVHDDCPVDPLEEFGEGELWQFDSRYKYGTSRPGPKYFKSTLRANPRRVFYIHERCRDGGYFLGDRATIKNADEVENADGYYIVPEDVPARHRAIYAKGVIEQYSAWCEGDVWGVCVWAYDADTLELLDRDPEVWGYYGRAYAESELEEALK